MAPTFTVLFAHTPAQLPMSLTAFLVGTSVLYLIGGLLVPETRGRINPE
jgi:MHS family proline/betaine transporter-like MFS transporter